MASAKKLSRPSQRYTSAEFLPYVRALGQIALAWNDLQESFADIYWTLHLCGPPQPGDLIDYTPLRLWHGIASDRQQRKQLRTLMKNLPGIWQRSTLFEDL